MKDPDFEELLRKALHGIPEADNNLENTAFLARAQVIRRGKRERIPFRQFLLRQFRYIGWQLWTVQGLFLLLFDRMLIQLYGERFWDSPTSVARLLLCVSVLIVMMALPLLYRSRKYRMQEIESASCFSSHKLLMAKLTVTGIGDVLLLAGMYLTTMLRTSMQAGALLFYLLLPFLMLSAAYLYMMGHWSGNGFLVGSIALGTAMILFLAVLPGRWLPLFRQNMTLKWTLLCLGLLVFSAKQLRYLLYRSRYTELQIS